MVTRGGPLISDALTYDAADRLISGTTTIPATQATPSLTFSYNGLGALQYASGVASGLDYQDIKTDALGNRLWVRDDEQIDNVDRTRYHAIDAATGQHTASALGTPTCGPPGTGTKSCHPNWYEYELTQDHDLAGNVIATWGKETRGSDAFTADPIPTETRSFYDAADRLTYFNRHVNYVTPGEAGGVFEEYRYDALGRRVLVRSRRPSTCSSPCEAFVSRTVWDGDQILYEIRSSGQTGVNPIHMELEGGAQTGEDVNLFGIVAYAHAEGIDQPVGVLKQGASSVGGSGTWHYLTPHANYQGVWSYGTDASGSNCISVGANCPAWPGYTVTVDGQPQGADVATYTVWWGEILRGATTTGGPQYLRNRYYDAGTGRFTQLDPIGLAGGMNLYGFADGDPVNFADPMGLCPEELGGDGKRKTLGDCPIGSKGLQQFSRAAGGRVDEPGWADPLLLFGGLARQGVQSIGSRIVASGERSVMKHIFRDAAGHVRPATRSSEGRFLRLFERVANTPSNESSALLNPLAQSAGVQRFSETFRRGEVWVEVRNGVIRNAGVNRP